MAQQNETQTSKTVSGFRLLFLHLSCFLLVVLYVNMFQFWAWISKKLGAGPVAGFLPVLVTLAVIAVIVLLFIRRVNSGYRIKLLFFGLGIVGAFISLAIPDPHIPVKRVHVAEYIILSFAVRYTLSHRLQGAGLTFFTVLVTLIFGIHDEMLQGLHSLRYYGWRDIIVNGTAGLSGALLGHGLLSFERPDVAPATGEKKFFTPGLIASYVLLMAAVAVQVIVLYRNRGSHLSYPVLLPLPAVCLVIFAFYPDVAVSSQKHHGLQVVFWLALGLLVYPLAANLAGIEFL